MAVSILHFQSSVFHTSLLCEILYSNGGSYHGFLINFSQQTESNFLQFRVLCLITKIISNCCPKYYRVFHCNDVSSPVLYHHLSMHFCKGIVAIQQCFVITLRLSVTPLKPSFSHSLSLLAAFQVGERSTCSKLPIQPCVELVIEKGSLLKSNDSMIATFWSPRELQEQPKTWVSQHSLINIIYEMHMQMCGPNVFLIRPC